MGFIKKFFSTSNSKFESYNNHDLLNRNTNSINLNEIKNNMTKLSSEEKLVMLDNYINNYPGNYELTTYYKEYVEEQIENDKKSNNYEGVKNKYLWLSSFCWKIQNLSLKNMLLTFIVLQSHTNLRH